MIKHLPQPCMAISTESRPETARKKFCSNLSQQSATGPRLPNRLIRARRSHHWLSPAICKMLPNFSSQFLPSAGFRRLPRICCCFWGYLFIALRGLKVVNQQDVHSQKTSATDMSRLRTLATSRCQVIHRHPHRSMNFLTKARVGGHPSGSNYFDTVGPLTRLRFASCQDICSHKRC